MKTLFFAFSLLCCSAWLTAQTSSSQTGGSTGTNTGTSGSPAGQVNPASQQDNIQGCLTGSDGDFTLTDSKGIKYKLAGNTSRLSSYLEHQVEVKGKVAGSGGETSNSPMSTDTSTGTQGTGTATKQGVVQTFHVSKVTKISDSCSASK
jgi:hypothetical protein